jgi:hypothetical protein
MRRRHTSTAVTLRLSPSARRAGWFSALLALAALLAVVTWATLQQLEIGPIWRAVAAAMAAAVPLVVSQLQAHQGNRRDRVHQLSRYFRFVTTSGGNRVKDIRDPEVLGVSPAATVGSSISNEVRKPTPYVRRAVDDVLDDALASHQFVLLVGDAASGKSRSAYEAMRRCFPERHLLVPTLPASLSVLQNLDVELRDVVIWLDDLDEYLGPDGLTASILDYILTSDLPVILLATMRVLQYAKFFGPEHHTARLERKVLERAWVVRLDRRLDDQEQARAAEKGADPRIAAALLQLHRYGLAEYLAAGPALLERLRTGGSPDVCPVGAAIVRASIDWRRMQLSRPISKEACHSWPEFISRHS